jgi:hypothetical protein
VADGWCWFPLREEYCWLVVGGWFVVREKYCWLVADKPSEQDDGVELELPGRAFLYVGVAVDANGSRKRRYELLMLRAAPNL